MTPRVLVLELEQPAQQERTAQLAQELEQPAQQELLVPELELEPTPGLHVFLEKLPLRQGSTRHI